MRHGPFIANSCNKIFAVCELLQEWKGFLYQKLAIPFISVRSF